MKPQLDENAFVYCTLQKITFEKINDCDGGKMVIVQCTHNFVFLVNELNFLRIVQLKSWPWILTKKSFINVLCKIINTFSKMKGFIFFCKMVFSSLFFPGYNRTFQIIMERGFLLGRFWEIVPPFSWTLLYNCFCK